MAKIIMHTRTLDEVEMRELIIEGMKRRGYIVKSVGFKAVKDYGDEGSYSGTKIEAHLQIAMPEIMGPVQEQWNGEK